MAIARGTKSSGGTDFVTGFLILAAEMNTDLNTIVSGVNNITIADANVVVGANIDPSKVGDFSDNDSVYQTTAATAARAGAVDYTTLTTSLATTLEGEISRLRYPWIEGYAGTVSNATGLPVAGQWYGSFGKGVVLAATGMISPFLGTTAPSGWILWTDGSIGDATSGGTNRANKDTRELYRMAWRMFADAICPVTGGRGADPDADFDAHKPLRLPMAAGRLLGIAGTPAAADTFEAAAYHSSTAGTSTTITMSATRKFLTNNIVNGYTLTMTSGARNGETSVISGYVASTGVLTFAPALTGAPGISSSFTLKNTVTTRAPGDSIGKPLVLAVGTQTGIVGSSEQWLAAYGSTAAGADPGETTNYPPSFFMNWIIKL